MVSTERKYAYRFMLYQAFLEIRPLAWTRSILEKTEPSSLPEKLMHKARHAGVIADAFHNLAQFSALDFVRFDEERFWRDLELSTREFSDLGEVQRFRALFNSALGQWREQNMKAGDRDPENNE